MSDAELWAQEPALIEMLQPTFANWEARRHEPGYELVEPDIAFDKWFGVYEDYI